MAVDLPEYVRALEFDDLDALKRHASIPEFVLAANIGMADGDLEATHEPYSGERAELFGELNYRFGSIAKQAGRAARQNCFEPGPVYDFQTDQADSLYNRDGLLAAQQPRSAVKLVPDFVIVDHTPVALSRSLGVVVDLDACLLSRSLVLDQIEAFSQQKPFVYMPVANTQFMDRAIHNYYNYVGFGPNVAARFVEQGLTTVNTQGADLAFDDMAEESADVVLHTGTVHATALMLEYRIKRAHEILCKDGKLIVRAATRPKAGEIEMNAITTVAFDNGFEKRDMTELPPARRSGTSSTRHGHGEGRTIKTVVLTKR